MQIIILNSMPFVHLGFEFELYFSFWHLWTETMWTTYIRCHVPCATQTNVVIFVQFAISNSRPFGFSSLFARKYKTKSKNLMLGSVTLHLPCNNGFPLYDIQFTFMILPGCRHRTFLYSFGKVNFRKKYCRHTCSISLGPSVKPCQTFLTCFCYLFHRSFAFVSLLLAFITIHSFPLAHWMCH